MKLLELHLAAFGPFTDVRLDFSSLPTGLHVIHGPNEAGKSTALRAVRALLYGIPVKTGDAHQHEMRELRVGGRLLGPGGEVLRVTRRKGRQQGGPNTLLGEDGAAVDEAPLRAMLRGVGEELFGALFGLDHRTLREGGQALLEGGGHVGESLLEAGLGGVGLHEVLARLEQEGEELFTPLAKNRPLNQALHDFREAQRRSRMEETDAGAWATQQQGLEEARAQRGEVDRRAVELAREQRRLGRLQRALPLVARRERLSAERRVLGDAVVLPERAARDREEAERQAAEASEAAARLETELAALARRRAGLQISRALIDEEAAIEKLRDQRGSHDKAQLDLPRVRGELAQLEEDGRSLLRRLGRSESLDEAERLRIDAAAHARVKSLALKQAALEEQRRATAREAGEQRARLERQRERLAELPPVPDGTALRGAIERARRQGDLGQRYAKVEGALERLAEMARGRLAALGLWSGGLEDLTSLPLPLEESVARSERRWEELARQGTLLAERERALRLRAVELGRALQELERDGPVPTEEELAAARGRRDQQWAALRRAGVCDGASGEDYAVSVQRADQVADRLRREAERVARRERLAVEQGAVGGEEAEVALERAAQRAAVAAATDEWRTLWRPAGIEPLSPGEMRAWLQRHAALAQIADQVQVTEADRGALARQLVEHRAELERALGLPLDRGAEGGEALEALLERATRRRDEIERAARQRAELEQSIGELQRDAEAADRACAERSAALGSWRAEWTRAVAVLGLGPDASPEEATAILDALAELAQRLDEAGRTRRRVEGMERDAGHFREQVGRLTREHAPDLAALPEDQAAAQLVKRHQQACADLAERERIDEQAAVLGRALDEERRRRAAAEARLAACLAAARAPDLASLRAAEARSLEARELDRQRQALDEQLIDAGDGASLESITRELAEVDRDRLADEIERLEERAAELGEERTRLDRSIGSIQAGLERWEGPSVAEEAASEAQQHLARVRSYTERYLQVRLAAHLLRREMERYREQNQGPIVTRASQLFRRLTLGDWSGLKVGWGELDQPVLQCLRGDGREVEVEGLSDGTRDQLFLALRLASLERHAAADEPPPLVVDDILVHFDDRRARAGLEVLGELAERMQILFFTHHARLVELARDAVPRDRLCEHDLAAARVPRSDAGAASQKKSLIPKTLTPVTSPRARLFPK